MGLFENIKLGIFGIGIVTLLIFLIWDFLHIPKENDLGDTPCKKAKLRESLVLDIRAVNQYCLAFNALLGVMSLIFINNKETLAPYFQDKLFPFGIAFIAANISLIYIPDGYGQKRFNRLRVIWLRSIMCEQILIVSTFCGLFNIAYSFIF